MKPLTRSYDEAKALCLELLLPKKGDSYWYGQSGVILFVYSADAEKVRLSWVGERGDQVGSSLEMPLAGFWHRLSTKLFHNDVKLRGKQGYVWPKDALVNIISDDLHRDIRGSQI